MVQIMGKFDVLSTGITLVDLPGHGDVDNARDSMANTYLQNADSIFLVADIRRAKDDRAMHTYLHKHLSQIIVDGRIRENSIALVLTGADLPIGDNECVLEGAVQEEFETLKTLQTRIDKKVKSPTKATKKKNAHLEQLKERWSERRVQHQGKTEEKRRLLAKERSRIVEEALQDKYKLIYCDLSRLPVDAKVPSLPIFSVGSRDFQALINFEPILVFSQEEETGIPTLNRHLQISGESRSLADAINVVTGVYEFLSSCASQCSVRPAVERDASLRIQDTLNSLEERCLKRHADVVHAIKDVYAGIQVVVGTAVSEKIRVSAFSRVSPAG
ncbi:hypothetical protein B0H10DRAFT_481346 [Mycena sp. CBHHK59/15]|nr:hypothetical protein B0H10DRAFT_481346 [Mycena sp. CBHHK59/15]